MPITERDAALIEVMKAIATALEDEKYLVGIDATVKKDQGSLRSAIARFETAAAK
jgi:hypothetical protein